MSPVVADLAATLAPLPRALFTAEEVAESLSVSKTLVRQLTIDGVIPCRRIGGALILLCQFGEVCDEDGEQSAGEVALDAADDFAV